MSGLLRLTAMLLGVLVFAVVLSVCGEAAACEGCIHACCVKTDRPDRKDHGVIAKIVQACANFVRTAQVATTLPASAVIVVTPAESISPLLASQVAQLRV